MSEEGGGVVVDLTLEILKRLQEDLRDFRQETRANFDKVDARFASLESRIDTTNLRIDRLTDRFDHFRDFTGDSWRDHEERILRLERRDGPKLTPPPKGPRGRR